MKLYNSYLKKNKKGDIEDLIFVKSGFSFWAFIFTFLWFIYHKMAKVSIIVIAVSIGLTYLSNFYLPSNLDSLITSVGISIIVAINANYLYSRHLLGKGYEFAGCTFGTNINAAKLRFVEGFIDQNGYKRVKLYKFLNKKKKS